MQKIGIVIVLAAALFAVPALAQTISGGNGVDILAQGIFETEGSALQLPANASANLDGVIVGNDKALAFGSPWITPGPKPVASNDLEIKKNQQLDATARGTAVLIDANGNAMPFINAEQIKVGSREALAFGTGTATNHVKIVTNQMAGP
ncbi:MAG: hypothetical protein ACE14P_13250 [Methanotrichaceae archaeon]